MFGLDFGKYRTIVISIALFLFLDLGVLVLNFVISSEIAGDALNVNLARRQRMLSQRIAKVSLQIETRSASGAPFAQEVKELQLAYSTFDSTLSAFMNGGMTLSGAGSPIQVARIDDAKAQDILGQAKSVWSPYGATIKEMLDKTAATAAETSAMARQAEAANLRLLTLMNDLTTRVEQLSASKATRLRAVQVSGITLATLNFLIILFHFLRHLRESDRQVERARRETDNILQTTREGLFLLDPNGRIGSQHSKALSEIIITSGLAGRNFLDILRPMVTEKTLATTREYIKLLLKQDVKEKLIGSLNPLDCVEINLTRGAGETETHYLQFGFNRVMEGGQITQLLVTANDITRRIRLERDLKATEERAKGQMGMLVEILQVDPTDMHRFLQAASDGLQFINGQLKEQSEGRLEEKLNAIYRIAHRLKGDAAALGQSLLAKSFHGLEEVLSVLRERHGLSGEDFLPIAVQLKALFEELETVGSAVTRISQMRGVVTVEAPRPQHDPSAAAQRAVVQWQSFATQIAQRQGKQAELSYNGVDLQILNPALQSGIGSIVTQFIRNAIVHGIESPAERRQHGKPEAGRLSVYVSQRDDGGVDLSFRDDGQGIAVAKVRDAAVRMGRLSTDEAAALDPRRIAALIFEPGLSTRVSVDEDAGRGAGLDSVKELVTRLGGNLRIGSTPGEYCHFRIGFAANAPAPSSFRTQPTRVPV
jgi:HPt (histidine-containing phosphotransfer) domain-containing protein